MTSSPPAPGAASGGRRAFLASAVAGVALAATASTPDAAAAAVATPRSAAQFDVTAFGAVGDGVTDDTAAFQRTIDSAQRRLGVVIVPSGRYLIDSLRVSTLVKIVGEGADTGRFTPTARGGVNLLHHPGSSRPLLMIDGGATTIDSLTLHGNGSRAPLLQVENGFESRMDRIRLFDVRGTALIVNRANNNTWSDVFIDNCGSSTEAAMVVGSPSDIQLQTNTFTCYNLTIERSWNTALDVGWGGHDSNVVEFVRLPFLHIEAAVNEPGQPDGNTDPLIRLGNVRQIELTDALVYGGPGPLVTHRQNLTLSAPLSGGVRLIGGAFLGADEKKTGVASTDLVTLEKGDDFAALGTRFARFTGSAVAAGLDYGVRVMIDPTTTTACGSSLLRDDRSLDSLPGWSWPGRIRVGEDLVVNRHLRSDRGTSKPSASMLPAAGAAPPQPTLNGTDMSGFVHFGTGIAPDRGGLLRVAFDRPYDATPAVVICPITSGAATRPFAVAPAKTHFDISLPETPPKNVTKVGFGFTYIVVG